jgi:alkylation response protein AidB-like acyl-CoA dehydrogenase
MESPSNRWAGTAARCAREAVRLLLGAGGTRSFASTNPVQRVWRDLDIATRHVMVSPEKTRDIYAQVLYGLTPPGALV